MNLFHNQDILATACGRVCMHSKEIYVSTALASQRLGIKEVNAGIQLVPVRADLQPRALLRSPCLASRPFDHLSFVLWPLLITTELGDFSQLSDLLAR